jgi:hypothetical protein
MHFMLEYAREVRMKRGKSPGGGRFPFSGIETARKTPEK